ARWKEGLTHGVSVSNRDADCLFSRFKIERHQRARSPYRKVCSAGWSCVRSAAAVIGIWKGEPACTRSHVPDSEIGLGACSDEDLSRIYNGQLYHIVRRSLPIADSLEA